MATRNGKLVSLLWFHLDTTHPQYTGILQALRNIHEKGKDIKLGVNTKFDGTQTIVKLMGTPPILSLAQKDCVIRTYAEGDHDELLTLVTDVVADPIGAPSVGWADISLFE